MPAQVRQSSFLELYHIQKQTGNRTTANLSHRLAGLENQVVVGFDVNRISYKNVSNSGNNQTRLIALTIPRPACSCTRPMRRQGPATPTASGSIRSSPRIG